jgi:hypothetical protein
MRVGRYLDITPDRGASHASDATNQVKDPEGLSTDEIRQGVTGNGVRYVLAISLGAALIGLGLAWVFVI